MRMIRWMCHVTLKDRKPSSKLRECLGLNSISNCCRLRWCGQVERCSDDSVVKICKDKVFEGPQRKGSPRKTWYQVVVSDLRSLKLDHDLAQNRTEWKIVNKKPI